MKEFEFSIVLNVILYLLL